MIAAAIYSPTSSPPRYQIAPIQPGEETRPDNKLLRDLTKRGDEMMPPPQQQSLDLGLSLGGLASQSSLSSSTTSGQPSPWAAALSSSLAGDARQQQGTTTTTRASTSPDSAAALSSGSNKRERGELERTGAGSDEEDGAGGRKKLRLSKDQAALLEECFKTHSTLNPKQKAALAGRLGLRPRQVEVWFQNRRARTKLKQTEVDCDYLKRWCDRLADENKRLERELADLRAVAPSPAPSAALTMCPSCRRVATANHHQQQQRHPKSTVPVAGGAAGNVLRSHCQFFRAAVDRADQSTWNAALVTRELF